ncbi:MAG: OpgC domain-containing protein, partial [Nocardioides sp.]
APGVPPFVHRGTGGGGAGAAGQVYDLYTNARHLFDYPPPWFAVKELLLLHIGPWVLNVLGLFVVLLAVTPLVMALLLRRLWWVVLLLSWGAYAWGSISHARLLPSQFEDVFPLLIWQVAFVNGLVLGYHREAVVRALTRPVGKVLTTAVVALYTGALGLLFPAHRGALPGGLLPGDLWGRLYDDAYVRVDLQPGRLADMAVVSVVSFAFLTAWWKPVERAVAGFLVPLGQNSLYVFVVHTFVVIGVANIPGLDRGSAWQGTVIHVAELLVIYALVRRRVLFGVIPR